MCENKKIDHERLEADLRRIMPNCNKKNCEKGIYERKVFPEGVIICQGCMIIGDIKYGQVSIMPKGFVMPNEEV